jgi:tripartite-type tricarboxylate transporter receptor subunit TctC
VKFTGRVHKEFTKPGRAKNNLKTNLRRHLTSKQEDFTMKTLNWFRPLTVALVGGLIAAAAPVIAADVSFKGQTVKVNIGFHAGGGYDAYGRLVARNIGKYLPGNPTVLAVNFPGAGSLRLANYIYNRAPKNGLEVGIFASSAAFGPLYLVKQAKFKTEKFTWIGNINPSTGTCTAWHTSGIKSFEDLKKGEVIFGSSSPGSVASQHPRGFNALLGTKIKIIHGYPGSTGVLLAMKRGEIQGGCGFALSSLKARRRQEWKSGNLQILIQTGKKTSSDLAGVPHLYAMAKDEHERQVMDLIYGLHAFGRMIAAPPGLPKAETEIWRTAFLEVMKDAELLRQAKKQHLPINPWSGEKLQKEIATYVNYPASVIARARQAMDPGKILKVKLKKLVGGTISKKTKKRITVTDASGKSYVFKISGRRTKVKIAGKKAKAKALKVGMVCDYRYFAVKDLAPKIACK